MLNGEHITGILNILQARADFEGFRKDLELRVSKIKENPFTIYYDLANKDCQAVKITASHSKEENGWTIEQTPIIFRRYSSQKPQVHPVREYPKDIFDQFMQLINISGEDKKLLLKCYIIAMFYPDIIKPALMLHGEPKAAKTTFQQLLRTLVDPSPAMTLSLPTDIAQLAQQMMHNYVCYYENVSDIPKKVSDALCRGVTGDAFSKRELFTDDEDVIYSFKRCIGINGINLGAEESDLIDRGLILELEPIPKEKRRKLQVIWQEFEEIRPKLLGYIFDILSKVLRVVSNGGIELKSYPRFADFAEIGEIISRCMDNKEGAFTKAYDDNINLQSEETINAHVVGNVIKQFVDDRQGELWEGTMTQLLDELETVADKLNIKTTYQNRSWPKAPNSLSRRINEVKSNLREVGIVIEKGFTDQTKRSKVVKIWRISSEPSEPSEGSAAGQNHAQISSNISSYISDDIIKNADDIPFDNNEIPSDDDAENHAQISSDTKGSDDTDDTDDIFQVSQDHGVLANNNDKDSYRKIFKCFYCDECFEGNDGNDCNIKRVKHREESHPDSPNYPNPEDFENRLEK
jgi:hypothetical protein